MDPSVQSARLGTDSGSSDREGSDALLLAAAHLANGRDEQAIVVLRADPLKDATGAHRTLLATALWNAGRRVDARQLIDGTADAMPDSPDIIRLRAWITAGAGNAADDIAAQRAWLSSDPGAIGARRGMALAGLRHRQPMTVLEATEALNSVTGAVQDTRDTPPGGAEDWRRLVRGHAHLLAGRRSEAAAEYGAIDRDAPQHHIATLDRGLALDGIGSRGEAIVAASEFLGDHPNARIAGWRDGMLLKFLGPGWVASITGSVASLLWYTNHRGGQAGLWLVLIPLAVGLAGLISVRRTRTLVPVQAWQQFVATGSWQRARTTFITLGLAAAWALLLAVRTIELAAGMAPPPRTLTPAQDILISFIIAAPFFAIALALAAKRHPRVARRPPDPILDA